MAIRRGSVPADSFTIISNAWLRDPGLSWKAKGLLAYIASHAPGHQLTTAQIHASATDGPDAVRSAIHELESAGYLLRVELRDARGHRTGTDYELRDPTGILAGETPTGPDQGEQDVSAAQDQSGKSPQGQAGSKKTTPPKKTKEKTPSASPRGTRLPEDWMPSEATKEWCRTSLPPALYQRARVELTKFQNYWLAKTGRDATKVDWERTFRNWMLNAAERYGVAPTSGAPVQQFKTASERQTEHQDRQADRAKRAQQLMDETPGLSAKVAWERAGEEITQNGMRSSSPVGYIDGVVIDTHRQEVTGT